MELMILMEAATKTKVNIHDIRYVVCQSDETTLKEILDHLDFKLDINASVFGSTVLSETLYRGRQKMFEMLLSHEGIRKSININKCSEDGKNRLEPPIVTACRLGNKDAVKLLLLCGADIDTCDGCGRSALWTATRYRYGDLVEYLVSNGSNVNISHLFSHSPLYLALRYPGTRTPLAKYLLYHGADVDIQGGDKTLLQCALSNAESYSLAPILIEAGYCIRDTDISTLSSDEIHLPDGLRNSLSEEFSAPPPLQRLCRKTIRNCVSKVCKGKHVVNKLNDLTVLPYRMRAYLLMQAEFGTVEITRQIS